MLYWKKYLITRIPSGIWSRLYGSFPSALNTYRAYVREARLNTHGQKFDPESLWAYLSWNFAPIFSQQISILDPLTFDFLVRLGLNFHPMGEFGPPTYFVTDRNVTT